MNSVSLQSGGESAGGARGGFQIPSLDGIRAGSFLIVFLAHAGLERWVPGYLGLTCFFFLSGYLITTLLRLEMERTGGISLSSFYTRRALRIFPPFYLVLGVAILLTAAGVLRGPATLAAWPFQALHLTNYYIIQHGWWEGIPPGTWVYWSLAVEEHFYLVFPLLYLLLRRSIPSPRGQALALLGLCVAALAWRCWLVFGEHAPKDRLYVASDTRLDSILFGCVLALWGNPALDTTAISERRWKGRWLPAGLVLLLLSVAYRQPQYDQTLRYTLQGVALFPIFIVAVRYPEWAPVRLLNHPWVRFTGVLSYSLYLLHTAVIFGVRQWIHAPGLVQGALALGIAFVGAAGIHLAVEQPLTRLRKSLSPGSRSRREAREAPVLGSGVLPAVAQDGRPLV